MLDEQLKAIFEDNKVIAAVGLSSDESRPSNHVCGFLKRHGYKIIPVNPNETEVLGEKAYPDLMNVPDKIDIVQVFRKPDAVPLVVRDAIMVGAKVVWMQDGAGNPEAAETGVRAGLTVVVDDCMLRQFSRLFPEKMAKEYL